MYGQKHEFWSYFLPEMRFLELILAKIAKNGGFNAIFMQNLIFQAIFLLEMRFLELSLGKNCGKKDFLKLFLYQKSFYKAISSHNPFF